MDLLKMTKEDRADAVATLEKEIKALKKSIVDIKEQISDLTDENIAKIKRRKNVKKSVLIAKLKGDLVAVPGLVAAIIGFVLILKSKLFLGILLAVLGVAALVFGLIVRNRWKAYKAEMLSADKDLTDYDKAVEDRKIQIKELDIQIDEKNEQLDVIKDFEQYEGYYRFANEAETNHVLVFVTGKHSEKEDEPKKPKSGGKYPCDNLDCVEVYLNDVQYDKAQKQKFQKQNGIFTILELQAEEDQALQVQVICNDAAENYQQRTEAITAKKGKASLFVRYHVSTYQNGTKVFCEKFDSLPAFMEAVNLSKTDIMSVL